MCRLFGFRSIVHSKVHESLVGAENALQNQSNRHPDGWGVAYYVSNAPHLIKSDQTAINDTLFKKVSGVVSSDTVLAHLRKATQGSLGTLNTHPFQYGRWTFAHNGNIKDFASKKEEVLNAIDPDLGRFILGETDSECIFYFILTQIKKEIGLDENQLTYDELNLVIRNSIHSLEEMIGQYSLDPDAGDTETYLTFILTNGDVMMAFQGGKELYYSTYKVKCKDRDICPSFAPNCEGESLDGHVNHLIFSSEPLHGENVWKKMAPGELIGIDHEMKLRLAKNY